MGEENERERRRWWRVLRVHAWESEKGDTSGKGAISNEFKPVIVEHIHCYRNCLFL